MIPVVPNLLITTRTLHPIAETETNAEDKEMEEGEVPKTPTTPTKTPPKPASKKVKSDPEVKPTEEKKATRVKVKK